MFKIYGRLNGKYRRVCWWKAALAANTRERQNGRRVVDCGGKGRVATARLQLAAGAFTAPLWRSFKRPPSRTSLRVPSPTPANPSPNSHPLSMEIDLDTTWRASGGISKTIDLLWASVAAVVAVAIHSTPVPQTYPLCPQHSHSGHSTRSQHHSY